MTNYFGFFNMQTVASFVVATEEFATWELKS